MNNLNLDILIKTAKKSIIKDVNHIFSILLNEIQKYLGLKAINSDVTITIANYFDEDSKDFFSLGVRRSLTKEQYQIEVSEKYLEFIQIILLREAYLCFVPTELKEKEDIQISIHEIIESDLSQLDVINEWKALARSTIVNYDYLSAQLDKLHKFFKLEGTEKTQSPTQFFFDFIHKNILFFQEKKDDYYLILSEEFIYKTSKSLFNDEIVETIRVLVKIFYQVKLFKQYSEFENYFQEFKEKGIISTNLSKRKFSENLRWIHKCTTISPSYLPIYHKIDIAVVISILKFNPILPRNDIYNILDRIPFLYSPVFARNGFSEEIHCYFMIPKTYLKDLLKLIEKINNFGYIVNKECYLLQDHNNILNLNYFREYFKNLRKIINPNHRDYDNRFEFICSNLYDKPQKKLNLTLLDYIIFDNIIQNSITGFGFERRHETLQSLKDELLNHIESERLLIENLRNTLNIFQRFPQLKEDLFEFLDNNQKFGFFFINDKLQRILINLKIIEQVITQNPEIRNVNMLQKYLQSNHLSQLIEENLSFRRKHIRSIVFRDFIPLYFKSIKEYIALKEKYEHFYNFFQTCEKLKIFSLESMKEIIRNEEYTEFIYSTKENKLKQAFEKIKPSKITNQMLDAVFKEFLDLGLIAPELIDNIFTSSFAKYHPILLLKNTSNVNRQIESLIKLFPRVFLDRLRNLFTNESIIIIFTYFLNIKEKELFCSILYNIFKENLISFKRYFTSGITVPFLIKDFYDFDKYEFFYTKDLFDQSSLYVQKVLGDVLNPLTQIRKTSEEEFWLKEKNVFNLIKAVDNRVAYEQFNFDVNIIAELNEFITNLKTILLDSKKFKNSKQSYYFKNFIKSIKFIPNLPAFGLSQYHLYFHSSNVDEIDFKHLLSNSFQSIKYPTVIDDTNSFLIKYIFPYGKPNMKHLNWYTKTKRIIREYCLFSIKSLYQLLNFNYNLGVNGWDYDSNRFKIHMQKILFNPDFKVEFFKLKHFNLGKSSGNDFVGPNSVNFKALSEINTWKPTDLKSILGTRKHLVINNITKLISENLIFPYIKLRNQNFQDKIYIILPNVMKELNQVLIKIFSFFNYGFIYEIEGEYYIYGFNDEIKFENGLMIKLYFPQCEIHEFLRIFDLLFEYLEINDYIILTDLAKGKSLLKNIFGDLSFLESYNPLINLKWNEMDKIWINHKLYNEKFDKLYPNLFYGTKKKKIY